MAIYQIIIVFLPSSKSYRYFSEQNNYEHNRTQLFKKFYKMDKYSIGAGYVTPVKS